MTNDDDDDDPLYNNNTTSMMLLNNNNKKRQRKMDRLVPQSSSSTTSTTKMTARDWRIIRENYQIVCKGGRVPPPLSNFAQAQLHDALQDAIATVLRYQQPTPIQRQAIPTALQRRDMIGIAETGSGKTVAFGLPLAQYILKLDTQVWDSVADRGPLAICLAPTRELALQIDGELKKLFSRVPHHTKGRTIATCCIVGGQSIQNQAQAVRDGVHVVVGTPGRINECIEMSYLVLNQCCYVVLDEADRMVDMGFLPQVESILASLGGQLKSLEAAEAYQQELSDGQNPTRVATHRITSMFSATMPPAVELIAKEYLRHPAIVTIGHGDSSRKNSRIVQKLVWLANPALKEKALLQQLRNFPRDKVIVFVNEKKHADGVGRMVEKVRPSVVLHGGKSQEQREENLEIFRRRPGTVLVATDVAGRGLDIPDVAHVINFDLPTRSIESYTHRIGRTGRAGKEGVATSLITDEDEGIMADLKALLESTGNQVPDRLARHPAAAGKVQANLIF